MKKKLLTIILAVSVSASALAGCGNAAEPANSGSIVNNKSAAAGTESYTSSQEDSRSMAESSEDVAVDDKPAQGSIGESELPYYELGFSLEDFTIDGFSVYSGMTMDEMYDAINLPEFDDVGNSVDDGWSKRKTDSDKLNFYLHAPDGARSFVYYETAHDETGASGTSIHILTVDEYTIAEADFIQSPIIPGKTTLTEAIEALGIRDLLEAMGIWDTSYEDGEKFEFESQFSENSYCRVYRNTIGTIGFKRCRIILVWHDENGQGFSLDMCSEHDVISWVEIYYMNPNGFPMG